MANSFIGRQDLPLGLRNNNPGDIRPGDDWQGMIGTNQGFIVFDDITWGTRALATDLVNKMAKGENTIRSIVSVYAPPSENDTDKYIQDVSSDTGLDPDQVIPMDTGTLHQLMRAVMNKELGDQYSALVSDQDIDQGIQMTSDKIQSLIKAAGVVVVNVVKQDPGKALLIAGGIVLGYYLLKD